MNRNSKIISVNTNQHSINPFESLLNFLPCDRPIVALKIVENYSECPQNFVPIHKTLDLDQDADIFKENILFGKKNTRYLCISKTEGMPNFVLEKIKIISSSEHLASDGYISIKHTTDTNQKAWRKKQLVYKLTKTENVTTCITDIAIMTKKSPPPEGYVYVGELDKVHICYKAAPYNKTSSEIIDFTQQIENLRVQNTNNNNNVYPTVNNMDHYYESLNLSYQLPNSPTSQISNSNNNNNRLMPMRKAPLPPTSPTTTSSPNYSTLSHYQSDCKGIPFVLHPRMTKLDLSFEIPKFENTNQTDTLDYDFNLERQILCTTKGNRTSTNPFF